MTPDASRRSTQVFFGLQSTCPDLARFGQLFAQGGEWEGEQLAAAGLGRGRGRPVVAASSTRPTACSGGSTGQDRSGTSRLRQPGLPPGVSGVGQLVPGAPEDMYAALGFGGQVVLVDPGSGTVVVAARGPSATGATPTPTAYTVADAARGASTEALVE